MREDVKKLKSTVDFLNGVRVQNDCIINGVKTDINSKPVDVVLEVAKNSGANICEDEIEDAYFLNRNKQTNKASVVVKFTSKRSKSLFMKEKRKLNEVADMKTVYVNDFLTKDTLELLKYAKSLKTVGYKFVYAKAGKIFARKDVNSKQVHLKDLEDVDHVLKSSISRQPRASTSRAATADGDATDFSDEEVDDDGFLSPKLLLSICCLFKYLINIYYNLMISNYFKNIESYNSYITNQSVEFFNVISINARSVASISKFNRFRNEISKFSKLPAIIAIQETWFSSQMLNLYSIFGFDAVNCSRSDGFGGTTIYIN